MHPLKMTWLTIFLTWLMRQASPTGRDVGEDSVVIPNYKYTVVIEEEGGTVWHTQKYQFSHPLIFAILIICPTLK